MKQLLFLFCCFAVISVMGQSKIDDALEPFLEPSKHLDKFIDIDKMIESFEEADWDKVYKTSDEAGEKGTSFSFDVNHPPENAKRVGSICMDGTSTDLKGGGACAGYGGVRFWIYEDEAGTRTNFPTTRHLEHPKSLNEMELSSLTAHNKKLEYGKSYEKTFGSHLDWMELLAIVIVCITIAFITKTLWGNNSGNNNDININNNPSSNSE